jgi:hypothetical protein
MRNEVRGEGLEISITVRNLINSALHRMLTFLLCGVTAPPPSRLSTSEPGSPHSRDYQITRSGTPQSVGLLCTSDQPVAETST